MSAALTLIPFLLYACQSARAISSKVDKLLCFFSPTYTQAPPHIRIVLWSSNIFVCLCPTYKCHIRAIYIYNTILHTHTFFFFAKRTIIFRFYFSYAPFIYIYLFIKRKLRARIYISTRNNLFVYEFNRNYINFKKCSHAQLLKLTL